MTTISARDYGVPTHSPKTEYPPIEDPMIRGEVTHMAETGQLLTERQTTHGNFASNAAISQALKSVFASGHGSLNAVHREALDMIALKISRILSGHASFKDHWDDIAGYAKLAAYACENH